MATLLSILPQGYICSPVNLLRNKLSKLQISLDLYFYY